MFHRKCLVISSTTFSTASVKSGKAQNEHIMSALPPKADIERHDWHVCFVPKADKCTAAKSTAIRPPRRRARAICLELSARAPLEIYWFGRSAEAVAMYFE